MQRLRVIIVVYWAIVIYIDWATILSENGLLSLPFSLAGPGDFESLLRTAVVSIVLGGIGLVGNFVLIRRSRQRRKATGEEPPPA